MPHPLLPFVLVVSLLFVGACTDEEEPPATGGGETSESPTSPTTDTTPTDGPTSSSTVEPAAGPRLELGEIAANAPKGWRKDDLATDYQLSASHPKLVTLLFVLQVPDPTNGAGGLDRSAKDSIRASAWLQKPKILEPTEIDGVEVYHIAGRIDRASFIEEFGTTVDGQAVRVQLQMTEIMSNDERRELVESVIQTVELGG